MMHLLSKSASNARRPTGILSIERSLDQTRLVALPDVRDAPLRYAASALTKLERGGGAGHLSYAHHLLDSMSRQQLRAAQLPLVGALPRLPQLQMMPSSLVADRGLRSIGAGLERGLPIAKMIAGIGVAHRSGHPLRRRVGALTAPGSCGGAPFVHTTRTRRPSANGATTAEWGARRRRQAGPGPGVIAPSDALRLILQEFNELAARHDALETSMAQVHAMMEFVFLTVAGPQLTARRDRMLARFRAVIAAANLDPDALLSLFESIVSSDA